MFDIKNIEQFKAMVDYRITKRNNEEKLQQLADLKRTVEEFHRKLKDI